MRDGTEWTRDQFESLTAEMARAGDLRPERLEEEIRSRTADGFDDDFSLLIAETSA